MLGRTHPNELLQRLMRADELGVRLEVVQDTFTWEFSPSPLHQGVLSEIDRSVRPLAKPGQECDFYTLANAYVRFPDGSLKRPDLMVFCTKPTLTRDALTVIPDAVVEDLSPDGYRKDVEMGPPFYLSQGVRDVVVVDPETKVVHHFRRGEARKLAGPVTISLECGCELTA